MDDETRILNLSDEEAEQEFERVMELGINAPRRENA